MPNGCHPYEGKVSKGCYGKSYAKTNDSSEGDGYDSGKGYSKATTMAYSKGYDSGKGDGYSRGYDSGKGDGYSKGYDSGKGYNMGYDSGKGYSKGSSEGDGYDSGVGSGDKGHSKGDFSTREGNLWTLITRVKSMAVDALELQQKSEALVRDLDWAESEILAIIFSQD